MRRRWEPASLLPCFPASCGGGSGAGAGDPRGNAQNPLPLLGKLLGLDGRNMTAARSDQIPASNPYYGMNSRRNEIWALGLRDPWRFSADGDLLCIADVANAGAGDLDYGWNIREASVCFGGGAITGGYVYRGANTAQLTGSCLFSDY